MHYFRFFYLLVLMITILSAFYFYFDESIRKPFSLVSILKTIVTVLLAVSAFGIADKLKNRVSVIRL